MGDRRASCLCRLSQQTDARNINGRRRVGDGLAIVKPPAQNCNEEPGKPQREVIREQLDLTGNAGVFSVTSSSSKLERACESAGGSDTNDLVHNPSYPARDHFSERTQLEQTLRSSEERLGSALQKLISLGNDPRQPVLTRLFHQMQGARDQIAETVRRLPLETGDLYHEDEERFAQAVAAFERTWMRWGSE